MKSWKNQSLDNNGVVLNIYFDKSYDKVNWEFSFHWCKQKKNSDD
jgi:hypothetical protein